MSFLNLRKKKKEEEKKEPRQLSVAPHRSSSAPIGRGAHTSASVLRCPHISEKSVSAQALGVYVFRVSSSATKQEIKKAVLALYKVMPRKVRVVSMPAKRVLVRNRRGMRGGGRKAYVYLKKGDKIEML